MGEFTMRKRLGLGSICYMINAYFKMIINLFYFQYIFIQSCPHTKRRASAAHAPPPPYHHRTICDYATSGKGAEKQCPIQGTSTVPGSVVDGDSRLRNGTQTTRAASADPGSVPRRFERCRNKSSLFQEPHGSFINGGGLGGGGVPFGPESTPAACLSVFAPTPADARLTQEGVAASGGERT